MALSEKGISLLDIAVKGVFGAAITGLLTFYGFKQADRQAEQSRRQEANQAEASRLQAATQANASRLQAAIELTSKQKDLEVDLGMRMFGTLMTYYFQKQKPADRAQSLRQQLLLLRLTALNFQDVPIQLRPLFEELDRQLEDGEQKRALRAIAQEVARRQAFRLTANGGQDFGAQEVRAGSVLDFPSVLTKVHIQAVTSKGVKATITYEPIKERSIGPFLVTFFDAPIVDNTELGENRVALILEQLDCSREMLDCKRAQVRFLVFRKEMASDRFDIKERSEQFLRKTVEVPP